jgi:type I restriction-modification system DNA methylase subunit
MSLFQKSVEQKYLKQLDARLIGAKYSEFKVYFGNPKIQENIRNSKEEQFQEGFLSELFVKILGYTLNPNPNFNLTTEYKNIKDSKKADGAIIVGESVKAVIELKGTNTTDLGKIEAQAFGYKNNQPDCVYVVTSNFEKLRFYIDNAIEFIEFNLFKLTKMDFEILYLCLSHDQIAKGIPKKVKDESLSEEDVITKKLYSDYSLFKRELHQNLVSQNHEYDALTLFRKSQKLLDRFLFLFFAEDRQLLPPNSVRLVLNDWKELQERDVEVPLYDRFKKYFGYLNTGFKGKRYDVFAYNGGLFKPDEILDKVTIDDMLLFKHASKLSEYDFASEVDVNILGHIFENSLNELDEIQAQLDGREVDKTKTKRKKDGVFYTPKYITKYIVENTVGKLCSEKKAELRFSEEDYTTDKKRQIKTKQVLLDKLKTYQNWLLQLTICDPACGSGAFLNQALDFLIAEHRYIDELQAKLLGVPMILSDVEKGILENNLFGVDLNEESVEIAKLSLWLRTAQPNRKLNDLSNNIKCGNSLISDPAVAGDKAFDWEREFPQVFDREKGTIPTTEARKDETPDYLKLIKEKSLEAQTKAEQALALSKEAAEISKKVYEYAEKLEAISDVDSIYGFRKSGFDVVIGNPPYVRADSPGNTLEFREYLVKSNLFGTLAGKWDLFIPFIEQSIKLARPKGKISLIIPDAYCHADYANKSLEWAKANQYLFQIDYFPEFLVFQNVGVKSVIVNFQKSNSTKFVQRIHHSENSFSEISFESYPDSMRIDSKESIMKNVSNHYLLSQICYSSVGIVGNSDEKKFQGEFEVGDLLSEIKNETHPKLYFEGKDIGKWILLKQRWIEYGTERSPSKWRRKGFTDMFEGSPKLIAMRSPGNTPRLMLDENNGYFNESAIGFKRWIDLRNVNNNSLNKAYENEEQRSGFEKISALYSYPFLLAILNSSVIRFELNTNRRSNIHIYPEDWKVLKIPQLEIGINQIASELEIKADLMLSLNKELQEESQKFQRTIQRKFDLEVLPGKLQNWYLLSYKEYIAELGKKKVKLSLKEEAEWEDYFLQEAKKVLDIKTAIETTDKEIDQMVYQLYGLTEEEIRIIEA